MTLTLLPAVDIRGGRAVRLTQGRAEDETVYDEDPVEAALRWAGGGAEWLHVVDLDAAFTGEPRNRHLVRDIVAAAGVAVQASGGIRSVDDVATSLDHGARRVVVGTMALRDPAFVESCLERFGDAVAVGLDARGDVLQARGWTEPAGQLLPTLQRLTTAGVERFVFTDVTRDGTLTGPNVAALRRVAEVTTARVTASGGVASLDDLRVLSDLHPRIDAVIVGRALYAGAFTLEEALNAVRGT